MKRITAICSLLLLAGCMNPEKADQYWLNSCCVKSGLDTWDCSGCNWNWPGTQTLHAGYAYTTLLRRVHLVRVGMTYEDVTTILGVPFDVRRSRFVGGNSMTWTYGYYGSPYMAANQVYVYFRDGKVAFIYD